MATNYILITFVFISLIQEHKQLEMAGGDAQRLFSQTKTLVKTKSGQTLVARADVILVHCMSAAAA